MQISSFYDDCHFNISKRLVQIEIYCWSSFLKCSLPYGPMLMDTKISLDLWIMANIDEVTFQSGLCF